MTRRSPRPAVGLAVLAVVVGVLTPTAASARALPLSPASVQPVVLPPVHARVDYQLGGGYTPPSGVTLVTRDLTDTPARGVYNICYVNAFQTQGGDAHWWLTKHSRLLLHGANGRPIHDPGWPDEMLLDTSSRSKRAALASIMAGWFARCAAKGFLAIEPDNLDSWTRSGGRLALSQNAAYARLLVNRAHGLHLAIAQKNDTDMLALHATTKFDFAVTEECQVYAECDSYTRVYGRHVIEIEYSDNGGLTNFHAACTARGASISLVYRDRDLVTPGTAGYTYAHC